MKFRSILVTTAPLVMFILVGCSTTYTLRMHPTIDPKDTSSISPKLKSKKFNRIMIMPPSGTARGTIDNVISLFEKEFIKSGITPINGAVTGRVVMQHQGEKQETKDENAQNLSDVERALIMAKETGADALLQIGQFEWSKVAYSTRYFIADPKDNSATYREVNLEEFQSWPYLKLDYKSPWFTFIGRLTDVQTGEVMASFKVESASNWNLPSEYVATLINGLYIKSVNYDYVTSHVENGEWKTDWGNWYVNANEKTLERVIAKVAADILAP